MFTEKTRPHAMCEAASWASRDLNNIPVLVFSMSGETAFYMSKIRNQSPIFAFSPSTLVVSQLSLAWNTRGFLLPFNGNSVAMQLDAEKYCYKKSSLKRAISYSSFAARRPLRALPISFGSKKSAKNNIHNHCFE